MKLLLALMFALVTVVNAPASCAHARGAGVTSNEQMIADHGGHGPMMHSGAAHHQHNAQIHSEHLKPHQDCASDCDGGFDCEGCTIGATAVLMQNGEAPHAAPGIALDEIRDIHNSASFAAEPPPPRAL